MNLPRILTIMGSGETSPTMVKVHRAVLERLGPPPVPAVMLDTPFGFQENADELCAKAIAYFAESLVRPIEVASFRSDADLGTKEHDQALARVRGARYVFAGPGSPTYALRLWRSSLIPSLLTDKLSRGGAITFASAAACTLGAWCAPIYEIYKVGAEPGWLPGIDLMAATGLLVAVIPHFNNAEGGTHDTRYCYLGERRLAAMEEELPDEAFVLGIDEHTGVVLDLESGIGEVVGNATVTVRKNGRMHIIASGETFSVSHLAEIAADLGAARARLSAQVGAAPAPVDEAATGTPDAGGPLPPDERSCSPYLEEVCSREVAFYTALEKPDVDTAVQAILDLDRIIAEWATETFSGDERERSHAALRGMVLALGELAAQGVIDPRSVVGPYVEALLTAREEARSDRRFGDADRLRDLLAGTGIEVRDTPQGTEWYLPVC